MSYLCSLCVFEYINKRTFFDKRSLFGGLVLFTGSFFTLTQVVIIIIISVNFPYGVDVFTKRVQLNSLQYIPPSPIKQSQVHIYTCTLFTSEVAGKANAW